VTQRPAIVSQNKGGGLCHTVVKARIHWASSHSRSRSRDSISMGVPWARISRTSLSFPAFPVTKTMNGMNLRKKWIRSWRCGNEERRSPYRGVLMAWCFCSVSFGLWATEWYNLVILSYLITMRFKYYTVPFPTWLSREIRATNVH
jgi:hypothetical protein